MDRGVAVVGDTSVVRVPTSSWIDHYDEIAAKYDELYEYKIERFADIAIKWLNIKEDDMIADVGGGIGAVAETIKKKCPHLKSNILVIDPSPKSIELAKEKRGVDPILADADEFLALPQSKLCNKYLVCCASHHFPDQDKTYRAAYERLPTGGEIVVLYHPKEPYLPLWKEAHEYRFKIEPPITDLSECLSKAGFVIATDKITQRVSLVKKDYFLKLRNRIMSTLHFFDNEKIAAGIKELDKTVFQGADSIMIDDVTCVVHAVKK